MKVAVVIYGVLERSLRFTMWNHQRRIIDPLRDKGIPVDVFYISNNIGDAEIDGVPGGNWVGARPCIRWTQEHIDQLIISQYPEWESLWKYRALHMGGINLMRNSFMETMAAEFILSLGAGYTGSVALCSDLWFEKDIDPEWVTSSVVTVSDQNAFGLRGYDNGFYSGKPAQVGRLMHSFYDLKRYAPIAGFEQLAVRTSQRHNISVKRRDFRFLKIRANGEPAYKHDRPWVWKRVCHIEEDYRRHTP